jgi:hypothetical protein
MTPPDNNPKTQVGRLKPPISAIPPSAIIALGLAMENGEAKYGLMNWRANSVASSVYYNAAIRHFLSWWDGENKAADSGIHHLAHVMACCAILLDAEVGGNLIDDRPMAGPAASFIDHLHGQRMDALLAGAVGEALAKPDPLPAQPRNMPFWRSLFTSMQPKEPPVATELETIAAAVARSEATSEKALALVQNLSVQLENIRATTTDDATRAKLLALANELNAESDKVEAAETAAAPPPSPPATAPVSTPEAPATQPSDAPVPVASGDTVPPAQPAV